LQLRVIAASMEAVAAAAAGGQLAAATVMESNKRKEDHRQLPRSRMLTRTTTTVSDMILRCELLIRLIVTCSNRQTFKSCKMLLQEKEEQSLESTMPLAQCRQL
jgi:hypothetical protein